MSEVRGLAAAHGIRIELCDLGDWGSARLLAEYDPDGPVIRVDRRASDVERAIAHELYHYREAIGEIATIARRADREAAADAYADALLAMDRARNDRDHRAPLE